MEIWWCFPIVLSSQGHDYPLEGIQEWVIHCIDENVVHENIIYIKDTPIVQGQNEDLRLNNTNMNELPFKRNML